MSILGLLNQIQHREIVLPAIQRDFVWGEARVEMLLDSIMRGYPVGIVLLWETFESIQYRWFEADYTKNGKYAFQNNSRRKRLKVVLDGQQRLQSLYVALYGKYMNKQLYFDVLSGLEQDDFSELKYVFKFGTPYEAEQWNKKALKQLAMPAEKREEDYELRHFVRVENLFAMSAKEGQLFQRDLGTQLNLSQNDDLRVAINLARFQAAMAQDDNILQSTVIDENEPSNSPNRKSETDVLEIFVRINRQGMPLSHSDLIFSMLKLTWKETAEALPEFVASVNRWNAFAIDIDFVIRCLFAVCDLGTRFDLELLRRKANVQKMKENFSKCCDAIRSTLDFVKEDCWCSSSKVLGSSATLIPFVYYVFHLPKHQIPNRQVDSVRKAVYLFGFTIPFSRYADGRLGAFIRRALKPLADEGNTSFPLDYSMQWVEYWEGVSHFNEDLFRRNPALVHYLIQQRSGGGVQYQGNAPEVDHIFPRSILKQKRFNPAKIEHFANFWILSKGKNQNKSNMPPRKYFQKEKVSATDLKRALIKRNMLDYRKYNTFLKVRSKAILDAVSKKLGLSEDDFIRAKKAE